MATLTSLLSRVENILADQSNDTLKDDEVIEGIRQALDVYSKARPYSKITTLVPAATGREIDISSITDLLNIERVWIPYTASSPEYPPRWRSFEHWQDVKILYINDDDGTPTTTQTARIFYTAKQTLQDLDDAASTTFSLDDESMICKGAAGYAILSRAREATEEVTIDTNTEVSDQIIKWATLCIDEFKEILGIDKILGTSGSESTGPAIVTVKRLTRSGFFDEDYPTQQPAISS